MNSSFDFLQDVVSNNHGDFSSASSSVLLVWSAFNSKASPRLACVRLSVLMLSVLLVPLFEASSRRRPNLLDEEGSSVESEDILRASEPLRSQPGLFGIADKFGPVLGVIAGEFVEALRCERAAVKGLTTGKGYPSSSSLLADVVF